LPHGKRLQTLTRRWVLPNIMHNDLDFRLFTAQFLKEVFGVFTMGAARTGEHLQLALYLLEVSRKASGQKQTSSHKREGKKTLHGDKE
jgi:hypothetical protein